MSTATPSGDISSSGLSGITLIFGGARSGKSAYAEGLVEASGGGVYLATATASDDEMNERISAHKARRGSAWTTREEPLELARALDDLNDKGAPVLVDCLTLWMSNLMANDRDIEIEIEKLIRALRSLSVPVVLVSLEVGLGIVPENKLARQYRDHVGRMNQAVAAIADSALLITAGLPLKLK
jgi:adenosylcobinamide kinase/adenosylcobinamide-phosphate guanylyltransferase